MKYLVIFSCFAVAVLSCPHSQIRSKRNLNDQIGNGVSDKHPMKYVKRGIGIPACNIRKTRNSQILLRNRELNFNNRLRSPLLLSQLSEADRRKFLHNTNGKPRRCPVSSKLRTPPNTTSVLNGINFQKINIGGTFLYFPRITTASTNTVYYPSTSTPSPSTHNPTTVTSSTSGHSDNDDDDDDDVEVVTEIIPGNHNWEDNHPCRYGSLEHHIEVNRNGRRVSDIQCEYNMWNYKYKVLEAERKRIQCSELLNKSKESITEVIGGKKAAKEEFPHMGAVGWKLYYYNDYLFMCGSSLISTRFAISSAHCSAISPFDRDNKGLVGTSPEIVRFGSVLIRPEKSHNISSLKFLDIKIDGPFIVLKKYQRSVKYNDVALIRLVEEVDIYFNVRPACLWRGDLGGRTVANVTGWGQTSTRQGSESSHLLYAELDFIDRDTCNADLKGRTSEKVWRELVDHQFCAGKLAGNIDTCQGDSGGPIQIQSPLPPSIDKSGVMYHVVGVTSFGIDCARANLPGVYVNVSDPDVLCWVEKTVWPDEPNAFCSEKLYEGYVPPP